MSFANQLPMVYSAMSKTLAQLETHQTRQAIHPGSCKATGHSVTSGMSSAEGAGTKPRPPIIRPVKGAPGYYIASDGTLYTTRGTWDAGRLGLRRIQPSRSCTGYEHVSIRLRDGSYKPTYIHRIVLETFVGPCPDNMETRHLNGNRTDNHVDNLRWGTKQENVEDKLRHGSVRCRLKRHQARRIYRMCIRGKWSIQRASALYAITNESAYNIVRGRTWKMFSVL